MSETKLSPDELEVAPGFEHEQLQGWIPELASEEDLRQALEKAFDYRGDVKITRKDGSVVDGYLYDRRQGRGLNDSMVRLLPADGTVRVSIAFDDVAGIAFDKRDPAAGKSWEAWTRKYWEKKKTGEKASIEPDEME